MVGTLRGSGRASKAQGVACAAVSSALFGFAPILIGKTYAVGMGVFGTVLLRMAFAAAFVVCLCLARRERLLLPGRQLAPCVAAGAFYAAATILSCAALRDMDPGLSNTLFHLYPLIVLFVMSVASRRSVSRGKWVAAGAMVAGAALIFSVDAGWRFTGPSVVEVGLAALCYAAYTLVVGSASLREVPAGVVTAYSCVLTVAACFALLVFAPHEAFAVTFKGAWLTAALALACTVLPLVLYVRGSKLIGSANVALLSGLEPGMTVAFESFTRQALPALPGLVGCALIVASGIFVGLEKD